MSDEGKEAERKWTDQEIAQGLNLHRFCRGQSEKKILSQRNIARNRAKSEKETPSRANCGWRNRSDQAGRYRLG